MTDQATKDRLEYLRGEIEAERISYGDLVELQNLSDHIEPGDVQLLQWAGVPEEQAKQVPAPRYRFGSTWTEDSGARGVHVWDTTKEQRESLLCSLVSHDGGDDPHDVAPFVQIMKALNAYPSMVAALTSALEFMQRVEATEWEDGGAEIINEVEALREFMKSID